MSVATHGKQVVKTFVSQIVADLQLVSLRAFAVASDASSACLL
jgi:hypothetical protein